MNANAKILNRLDDVSIIRCIAVLSLVVWHSFCPIMFGEYWNTPINNIYGYFIIRLIPDANMPLFTFLAGYLFCYQLRNGKYSEFKQFLTSKIHRLLIPFIVLGTIINLLEYGKNIIDLLYGGPNHLWYCLMLFYSFLICWFVEKKVGAWLNYVLMGLSFCAAFYYGSVWSLWHTIVPGGWEFVAFYYGYFYLGFLIYKYKDKLFLNKWMMLLYLVCYVFFCKIHLPYGCVVPLRSMSYIMLLFSATNMLISEGGGRFAQSKPIQILNQYSFGIYVFHQWILWNVSHIPYTRDGLRPFVETHYFIAPICIVIMVLFLSMILTHYSLKTKIGRYLLC